MNQGIHEQEDDHDLMILETIEVKLLYLQSHTTNFPVYHEV